MSNDEKKIIFWEFNKYLAEEKRSLKNRNLTYNWNWGVGEGGQTLIVYIK